jgi:hypothetical protein
VFATEQGLAGRAGIEFLRGPLDDLLARLAARARPPEGFRHEPVVASAQVTRIDAARPGLGRHLNTTVRTGTFCSYSPTPGRRFAGGSETDSAAHPFGIAARKTGCGRMTS